MATLSVYTQGNEIVVRAEFRVPDDEGVLTDPSTVTFTARRRSDTATPYLYLTDSEVTRTSAGIFLLTFLPTPGHWYVHCQGTGTAHAAEKIEFDIDASEALAA